MKPKHEQTYFQQFISFKPNYVTAYGRAINPKSSNRDKLPALVKRADNRSFTRLNTAIGWLVLLSPRQYTYDVVSQSFKQFFLNFITLTLSSKQLHSDSFIQKHMLQAFLKWLVRQGATGYVWKAERQKNGNIHYHITTNKFIHYMAIRNKWNDIQDNHGYMNVFFSEYNHKNANSTDVKSVKDVARAMKYLTKYILKKEPAKTPINGHQFGYSKSLTNIKLNYEIDSQPMYDLTHNLISDCFKAIQSDFFRVYITPIRRIEDYPPYIQEQLQTIAQRFRSKAT